ncbi:MAG: RagB/SusD family nutrient uptake outer membrane protein [Cytophagaceae bacterium]|nr:RagB/SusD family nutrient uptake outer membrane protein [Cytophagaceae bacterium]
MRSTYKLLIASLSLLTLACDVIHQQPQDRIAEVNFWKTADDAQSAIIGVYDRVQGLAAQDPLAFDVGSDALVALVDNDGYIQFDQKKVTVDNTLADAYWANNYSGIHRVNDIISRVPALNDPAFLPGQKEGIVGEAHFLRAHFYFNLVRAYGPVPLITVPYDSFNADFTVERTPTEQVYAQIIADLTAAETALPASYTDAFQTRGRATSGAAKALLARVYLRTGAFQNAADKAAEVIANPLYALVTGPAAYAALFTPSGKNGTEAIFEVQYLGSTGEGHGLHSRFMPVANAGQLGGNYWLAPSPEIVSAYGPGDIRKNAAIGVSTNPPFRNIGDVYVKKYIRLSDGSDPNLIAIRLADVILMRAEALNRTGKTAEATQLLNTIRRRAYNVPLTTASVYDFPSASDQTKGFDLTLALENERFLELAFEGQRWHDLVRTGRASAVLKISANQTLWPIPQRERDRNPRLAQNTGY